MDVRYLRVFLGQQRVEIVVRDGPVQRKLSYEWRGRSNANAPPRGWFETVKAEVELQKQDEDARARGRFLF